MRAGATIHVFRGFPKGRSPFGVTGLLVNTLNMQNYMSNAEFVYYGNIITFVLCS